MALRIHSLSPLLLLLFSKCMAATDCFTQVGDRYTKPSIVTHRVSVGIICPPSENNVTCPLVVEGLIQESATLNISTTSETEIFDAIQTADRPFNASIRGSGPKFTYPVEPGRTGYYGFTPTFACFAGTLGDCIGGDVQPGTPIEACTPLTLSGGTAEGTPTLDGTGAFVEADNISDMTTNPSATAMPAAERTQESRATSKGYGSGILLFVTSIGLLWCMI
ncbi:MAG: hypothetical protein Q9207_004340 [Kuettlingeria erythrocarpa]